MPTINDATVVATAYDTSGNGGRKLVLLSNGWLVSFLSQGSPYGGYYHVSKDNGVTWTNAFTTSQAMTTGSWSLVAKGTRVYNLYTSSGTSASLQIYDAVGNTVTAQTIDSGQNSVGLSSLTINEAGTELHATWASKNSTYPNSFNIRYAKGTINADGSVTWGAVEQVTAENSSSINQYNPSIVLRADGKAVILYEQNNSGTYYRIYAKVITGTTSEVFYGGSYPQSNPSAIFVPQSINGLANGRIWVAWYGTDATDTTYNNIRTSYSDDGGATWSAMQKRTTGNTTDMYYPSITANKANDIWIFHTSSGTPNGLNYIKLPNGGSWSATTNVKQVPLTSYPSTLYDSSFSINFTSPLIVFKDNGRVGFYGTWTVTTISVTQGSIGAKSDKSNLLTYTITTDGTMGTITESVNGTTIATKNIASGVQTICGLTQAQWDAIKYGKYNISYGNGIAPISSSSWEQGSIITTVGNVYTGGTATNRLRTPNPISVLPSTVYSFNVSSDYYLYVVEFNSSDSVVTSTGWLTGNTSVRTNANTSKVRFIVKRKDEGTILPAEITNTFAIFSNNKLTVSMGSDTFTYTFDKRLATNDDVTSAVKAVQDSQNTFLPAVKSKLASVITSKGGTATGSDSWSTLETAIGALANVGSKKFASGVATTTSFTYASGFVWSDNNGTGTEFSFSNSAYETLNISGLTFKPRLIIARCTYSGSTVNVIGYKREYDGKYVITSIFRNSTTQSRTGGTILDAFDNSVYVTSTGFKLPNYYWGFGVGVGSYSWEAFE